MGNMGKKQIRVFLEEEDIAVLQATASKDNMSLSEICRNIIREKIIAGAVDELTSKMMVEKRVEYLINNFEQRLKEIASNYIKVPAKIPTDLLVKSVIYGRANWEILKKQLTDNEKESIYNRALASVKEVSPAAGAEDIMRKPKIIFGRKT